MYTKLEKKKTQKDFIIICSVFFFLFFSFFIQRFCGYIFCKPSRDLTRPLGGTYGFKVLVAHVKCNRDSYKSELRFYFLFLGFFLV